jgi:hypothetical protein
MATVRYVGGAVTTAQVDTRTLAAPSIGSTYTVTAGSGSFTYTAASTTVATEAAALVAAFNKTAVPQLAELVAANPSGGVITFTARTPGLPFTAAYTTGGAGSPTFAGSTTTANSSPSDMALAANYSGGALPSAGDTLVFDGASPAALYSVDALAAVALAGVTLAGSYTGGSVGLLGLADVRGSGSKAYPEYRARYFKLGGTGAVTVTIGDTTGTGPSRVCVDAQAALPAVTVRGTGSPADAGQKAVRLKGGGATASLNVFKGSVAVAGGAGDAATLATLQVGYQTNVGGDADVLLGSGCTLTTVVQDGGKVVCNAPGTTYTKNAGTLTLNHAGTWTTYTDNSVGGSTVWRGKGTITTPAVNRSGKVDRSQEISKATINLGAGAVWLDPNYSVNYATPAFTLVACTLREVTIDVGPARSLAVS